MKIAFSEISLPKRGSLAVGVYAGSKLSASAESADEASGGQIRRAIAAPRSCQRGSPVTSPIARNDSSPCMFAFAPR